MQSGEAVERGGDGGGQHRGRALLARPPVWSDYAPNAPRPAILLGRWGGSKLELLEQMSRELIAQGLAQVALQHWPPPAIDPVWRTVLESRSARLQEGIFATPCEEMLKRVLPLESQTARVRLLSPRNAPSHQTSCVLHLAGILCLVLSIVDEPSSLLLSVSQDG